MYKIKRYNFRTGFSAHYKNKYGDDITTQIILKDCFYVECDGYSIVTHVSHIEEALDNMKTPQDDKERILKYLDENCDKGDPGKDYWFIDEPDFIEQSTGLLDKNGKLIFDGDILKSKYSDIMRYIVYRSDTCFRYKACGSGDRYCDDGYLPPDTSIFEVIGNIHENWDLVEEEMLRPITQDIGKVCAFYADNPSQVTYDTLTGIEDDGKSKKYTGESGLISCNCRRLNETENRLRSEWRKNG